MNKLLVAGGIGLGALWLLMPRKAAASPVDTRPEYGPAPEPQQSVSVPGWKTEIPNPAQQSGTKTPPKPDSGVNPFTKADSDYKDAVPYSPLGPKFGPDNETVFGYTP